MLLHYFISTMEISLRFDNSQLFISEFELMYIWRLIISGFENTCNRYDISSQFIAAQLFFIKDRWTIIQTSKTRIASINVYIENILRIPV